MNEDFRLANKSAFTLLEILIVVLIIGILATLAIPYFIKTVENARASEAKANLRLIYTGEKVYRLNVGRYTWGTLGLSGINTYLNLDIPENPNLRHFDYRVSGGIDNFTATASRVSGPNAGETITIDQDGNIDESGWSP